MLTPAGSSPPGMARVPALDGLRGVAMLIVLGYHLGGVTRFDGGWVAMDVFFALSGFLITSLLVGEQQRRGRIDVGRFYLRRARRLGPALLVILTAVVIWARVRGGVSSFSTMRREALATLGYVANWNLIVADESYFASFALSPLRHTWSLAVEEQFYLVWPLLIVGLARLTGLRRAATLAVLGALLALSAAWMAYVSRHGGDPSRSYFGTDTRAQALIAGSMLAVASGPRGWRWRPSPRAAEALGVVGVVALAALLVGIDERSAWVYQRGGFVVISAVAVLLVYACTLMTTGPLARLFANRWLCGFGVRTYSFYLWHWPVVVFVDERVVAVSALWLDSLRVAITLVLTEVTYRCVERPIHSGALRLRRPAATALSGVAVCVAVIVATTVGTATPATADADEVVSGSADGPVVLVIGDSSAWIIGAAAPDDIGFGVTSTYLVQCDVIGDEVFTGNTTFPSADDCATWRSAWGQQIAAVDPDVVVVSFGFRQLFDLAIDGERIAVGSATWEEQYAQAVGDAAAAIGDATTAPILWLEVPCYTWADGDEDGVLADDDRIDTINRELRDALAAVEAATVVDEYRSWLCGGERQTVNRIDLRPDGAHLTIAAAAELWRRLAPLVDDAVGNAP